jgi:hypothetical protein
MLQIGSVTKAAGMVSVRHPDGSAGELQVGNPVYQGDQVQTGADGAVGITLNDKSAFSLGPKGAMQLDELVYDPAAPADGHSTVAALHGAFTAVSGDVAKAAPGAMHIKTPVMTIGVRGTTVAGMAAAEGSQNTVTLMRDGSGTLGQVSISNAGGTQVLSGESHTLQLSSFIQPPPPPVALSAAQIQQLYGSALSAQPVPPAAPPANPAPPTPPAPSGNTGNAAPPQQAPVAFDPNAPKFIDAAGMIAAAVQGDLEREKEVKDNILTDLKEIGHGVTNDIIHQETQFGDLVQDMTAAELAFLDFLAGLDDLKDQFDLPDDILDQIIHTNWVFGTSAGEVLYGTDGRDFIFPDSGADTVYAGGGDDTVFAQPDEVSNTFYGGDGTDTISYADSSHKYVIDLAAGTATAGYGIDHIHDFEVAIGTNFDDTLRGSDGADTLMGGGGSDTYIESDGIDFILDGGGYHDLLSFAFAVSHGVNVNLSTGMVSNDGWGNVGFVTGIEDVTGSGNADTITGDDNDNILSGLQGDDVLSGGRGDDTLIGGDGLDVLTGGDGNDVFKFGGANIGTDTITDFSAGDRIWLDASGFGLTAESTNFLYIFSDWSELVPGTLTGAGIIAVTSGSDVQLWYSDNLSSASSGNSYQIATLEGVSSSELTAGANIAVVA